MSWVKIVEVPSRKAANMTAKQWKNRADKIKVTKLANGWYSVYALNPNELAKIVFGL